MKSWPANPARSSGNADDTLETLKPGRMAKFPTNFCCGSQSTNELPERCFLPRSIFQRIYCFFCNLSSRDLTRASNLSSLSIFLILSSNSPSLFRIVSISLEIVLTTLIEMIWLIFHLKFRDCDIATTNLRTIGCNSIQRAHFICSGRSGI